MLGNAVAGVGAFEPDPGDEANHPTTDTTTITIAVMTRPEDRAIISAWRVWIWEIERQGCKREKPHASKSTW